MVHKRAKTLVCLLLVYLSSAQSDVFEWRDAQGRHHYSDRTRVDAKILPVAPAAGYYVVKKVFDGDTILLSNGQKVRLLGVNTPEVAGRNKNAESGGEEAKIWLKKWLEHKKVRLEFDVEKQDKYQRRLAYVFTKDKRHVNLELVQRGLAAVNIYPPNLKYVQTLLVAQQEAEQTGLGIWRDPAYAPQSFERLNNANYKGWKRIVGRVESVKKTRKYRYLQFSAQVSVRIKNSALDLFPNLQDYVGRKIEARGWVNKSKDRFSMPIRHPGELKLLSD